MKQLMERNDHVFQMAEIGFHLISALIVLEKASSALSQ